MAAQLGSPLLFTNRPAWEGGNFSGEEENRVSLLLEAVQAGAAYIDIELEAKKNVQQQLIAAANKSQTQVIISWHNFKETPDYGILGEILSRQRESGAHIGKIVTMAHDFTDVLRVLHLQILARETHFPLIAFCMGKPGVISRLATLDLGGYMTYAAPDKGTGTAPGQIRLNNLLTILEHLHHAD
jgi:3-dehydroquinate dehydratase-1/3-dehydroquinate dehydratase/shikimate dehydrogenase